MEQRFTMELTKAELVQLRDKQGLSWAKVAEALALGSPGAARRAYSALVRPHTDSVLAGRAKGADGLTPVHLATANVTAIRKAIVDKTIVVQRGKDRTEEIPCVKVSSLKAGTVHFTDNDGKSRSVKAESIIAVK